VKLRPLFVPVLVIWSIRPACAELSEEEFFAQYEPAAQKLQSFYDSVTISAMVTRKNGPWPKDSPQDKEWQHPAKYVFYSDGTDVRLDTFQTTQDRQPLADAEASTIVAESRNSFTVRRGAGEKAFVLQKLTPYYERTKMRILLNEARFAGAAYGDTWIGSVTAYSRLKGQDVKISSIEEEMRGGESLVKVSYRHNSEIRRGPIQMICWFLFARDKCWALRGWSEGVATVTDGPDFLDNEQARAEIEYGDSLNGVPLLKHVTYWRQRGNERFSILDYRIDEIKPGPPSSKEFKLATFGIGDIRAEKETGYWLYLIMAGVVLLAAAFIVARISARRRGSS
jgi:hypothetical protein